MMTRIDEELVMAHLDGELDPLTAGRVSDALAGDKELRAMAEEQARLRERLAGHYGPVLDEPIPPRLRAMLETNVVALPARRRFGWRAWGAIAASFALGLVASQMVTERTAPGGMTGERLVAAGPLARALDSQLASEQPRAAATRIGVSFAANDGRICRTFENQAMAGLACRDGAGWQVVAHFAASPRPGGEYRQAGSGSLTVMRTAQELMKGEPFDAGAEREARDRGWVSRR